MLADHATRKRVAWSAFLIVVGNGMDGDGSERQNDKDDTAAPIRDDKTGQMHMPPTTTAQEDRVTAGQRRVSLLWESSQSIIGIAITGGVIYCQIKGIPAETLTNAFFFVIAMYLQRTNHTRIGGVGPKANEVYRGR